MDIKEGYFSYRKKSSKIVEETRKACIEFFKIFGFEELGTKFLDECTNECNTLNMPHDNISNYLRETNIYWKKYIDYQLTTSEAARNSNIQKYFFDVVTASCLRSKKSGDNGKPPFLDKAVKEPVTKLLNELQPKDLVSILLNLPAILLKNVSLVMSILFGGRVDVESTSFDTTSWESDKSHFLIGLLRSTDDSSSWALYSGLTTFVCFYLFYLIHFNQKMIVSQMEWNEIAATLGDSNTYPYKTFYVLMVESAITINVPFVKSPKDTSHAQYIVVILMAKNYIQTQFGITDITNGILSMLNRCIEQKNTKTDANQFYKETYGMDMRLILPKKETNEEKESLLWLTRFAGTPIFPLITTEVFNV
jgi:hypothetical protein